MYEDDCTNTHHEHAQFNGRPVNTWPVILGDYIHSFGRKFSTKSRMIQAAVYMRRYTVLLENLADATQSVLINRSHEGGAAEVLICKQAIQSVSTSPAVEVK